MTDLTPEARTLKEAWRVWEAREERIPGKRPFRAIGGPLHGATVRLDLGQSRYVAVEPRDPAAYSSAADLPDPYNNLVHYRMEKFGSGTHQMAVTVLLAENGPQGNDALPLLLDAFLPEMLTAYVGDPLRVALQTAMEDLGKAASQFEGLGHKTNARRFAEHAARARAVLDNT